MLNELENTPGNSNKLSNIDYFASLKYPDFLKMWLASMFAGSSYWALIVVRAWVVYQLSDSNMLVGLVTFAAMIPRVVVTPFVGYLSDKFQRRKMDFLKIFTALSPCSEEGRES